MNPNRYDEGGNRLRLARLSDRGVDVWGFERVYISEETPLEQIEPGAALYDTTITGKTTRIGRGSRIGVSGHARIADCQIGRHVEVGAGSYEGATILDRAKVRGFAEVRPGTLLEEDTEAAHSVAFKNTILTATCVAGSLINFCDVFMSGGTARTDHSEIGSGVVHFNFDPRGDKWGSLLGDARGALLRSAPVFVGGQCGLVGPLHVDFGAVLAAGSIVRRDVGPDRVLYQSSRELEIEGFDREIYPSLRRKLLTTARLAGNLRALAAWYEQVREAFADEALKPLYEAARRQTSVHAAERAIRVRKIVRKLERSLEKTSGVGDGRIAAAREEHQRMLEHEEAAVAALSDDVEAGPAPKAFIAEYEKARETAEHIEAVKAVSAAAADAAAAWLAGIAEVPVARMQRALGV